MNCPFDKEKLTAFYDGELDAAGKTEVDRHISSCSECLRDLGEIKSASLLVKELPRPRAPRSIAEGVSREIAATGRVHSFSKARSIVLWATAAAAGLFIVANVIFLAGGPSRESPMAKAAPETIIGRVPAAGEEEKKDGSRLDEAAPAGKKTEGDRPSFGQSKDAALKEREAGELGEARKADAEAPKTRAPEKPKPEMAGKAPEAAKAAAAPKPAAAPPAPPPPAAVPEAKQAPAEPVPGVVARQNRTEDQSQGPVVLNVTSTAKSRPQVEAIVRKYADRANADRGARQLEQSNDLKKSLDEKSATARRETGAVTLDLTPAEYEALKKEIEESTGAQLAFASNADGRLRAATPAAPPGAKAGPGTLEGARTGGGQAGGLAKAPAPNTEELKRKAAEESPATKENFAKKDQQQAAQPHQQAPANTQNEPLARDKNAQEDPRRLQAGETRIRIVINFLEVPVAEKK